MATLTTVDGYLVYDDSDKITKIPLTLLPYCTIVDRTTYVSILLPSQGTPRHQAYVDIPVPIGTITTTADLIIYITSVSNSITTESNFSVLVDKGATYTYLGKCAIGDVADTDLAIWQIQRIENASGSRVWASATSEFNQIWDNRATTILYS